MTEPRHYPGKLERGPGGGLALLAEARPSIHPPSATERMVAIVVERPEREQTEANAERLVACWNACHLIPTEKLTDGVGVAVARALRTRQALAEAAVRLLAALPRGGQEVSVECAAAALGLRAALGEVG